METKASWRSLLSGLAGLQVCLCVSNSSSAVHGSPWRSIIWWRCLVLWRSMRVFIWASAWQAAWWSFSILHNQGNLWSYREEQKFTSAPPSHSIHTCSRQNTVNLDTQSSSSPGVLTLAHKKITQEMDSWLCRCLGSDTRDCESPDLKYLAARVSVVICVWEVHMSHLWMLILKGKEKDPCLWGWSLPIGTLTKSQEP